MICQIPHRTKGLKTYDLNTAAWSFCRRSNDGMCLAFLLDPHNTQASKTELRGPSPLYQIFRAYTHSTDFREGDLMITLFRVTNNDSPNRFFIVSPDAHSSPHPVVCLNS